MDRELLRQCLAHHGESLLNKLACEQTENPDFQAALSDLSKATYERSEEAENPLIEQFIARKADILFCEAWKTVTHQEDQHGEEEEAAEPCAVMPPLELFMEVSYDERRAMLYRDLERGDVVVGRINNIREYGFFLTLLCTAVGLKRDIEELELSALCHIKEIPSTGSHDDPLSYYQVGDLIRAAVKDIDRFQEKITVSLHQASLPPGLEHVKLGVVVREELPVHYSRSVRAAADSSQTYERILRGCHGYHNPFVVDYLLEKVGVGDVYPPSMMRGLQSNAFEREDFASVIRKKQSASWALKCVRAGVDHFKHGRHVDAMNEYNKALEMDTSNVEALVARGALYANKGSIMKAISDFELALENCPDHRNAKKYLCQTLVERGKQLEEQEKLVTAEGLYRRALSLDQTNPEAKEALHKITQTIQRSIRLREEMQAKEPAKATDSQSSAEKLRKILKEEKRMKKKRRRSTSSSSSTSSSRSSSSSSSSSSARRRSKKKRKKKHRSKRRVSSRSAEGKSRKGRKEEEEEEEELEWYPAPPNTSATFLNQRGGPGFTAEEDNDAQEKRIASLYSLLGASDDDDCVSNSSSRGRRGREMEKTGGGRNGRSRSPEQVEREQKDRRDADSRRRSSLDGEPRPRESYSSTEHQSSKKLGSTRTPKQESDSVGRDAPRRNPLDEGRYERQGRGPSTGGQEECRAAGNGTPAEPSSSRPRKDLPANLLDIFNQIAQFEKEKGVRPKL